MSNGKITTSFAKSEFSRIVFSWYNLSKKTQEHNTVVDEKLIKNIKEIENFKLRLETANLKFG